MNSSACFGSTRTVSSSPDRSMSGRPIDVDGIAVIDVEDRADQASVWPTRRRFTSAPFRDSSPLVGVLGARCVVIGGHRPHSLQDRCWGQRRVRTARSPSRNAKAASGTTASRRPLRVSRGRDRAAARTTDRQDRVRGAAGRAVEHRRRRRAGAGGVRRPCVLPEWSKPNPRTATNAGYLRHIIDVGHFSVLEHASVSFYITGVSRSFTHELIRHRHFSYSQLSQRYVPEHDSAGRARRASTTTPSCRKFSPTPPRPARGVHRTAHGARGEVRR